MDPPTKRRGPGRPSNKPAPPTLPISGIVETPRNPVNLIEFITGKPIDFKILFTYFKNLKSTDIHIHFRKNDITFLTRDHSTNSRVLAVIDCRNVNFYYCKQEMCIGLNRAHSEKLFLNIDKAFFRFSIEYREDETERIYFIFRDAETERQYMIYVSNVDTDLDLFAARDEIPTDDLMSQKSYPLQFTMSSRQFKKTISDAQAYHDTITIEKIIDNPMRISYKKHNVVYNEIYFNDQSIGLVSANTDFMCKAKIANLKSLVSSIVTDKITIMCRETNDILICSEIDKDVMTVYTFIHDNDYDKPQQCSTQYDDDDEDE